jgi:dihydroorotate dehydrogenase electron transfer subunit
MLETARVNANAEPMKGAHLLWLEAPGIASQAKPGQFVMVRCGENDERPLRRPFSIHQREGDKIALLFNIVGDGTQWLAQRTSGDKIDLLGPLGNGFTIHQDSKKLLLVAGGIGIAPLRFLADEAVKLGLSTTLLYGTASATQLYPHLPKVNLAATTTEDGSAGEKGMITDLMPNLLPNLLPDLLTDSTKTTEQIFACGPMPMYRTMAKIPEFKNAQISLEVRMGCGLGVCYGCTVKTKNGLKQVCQDGPIFELNDILWGALKDI